MRAGISALVSVVLAAATAWAETPATATAPVASTQPAVAVSQNTARLSPYQVLELTFQHGNDYADPTWAIEIEVRLRAPSGKAHKVGGFFYGPSAPVQPQTKQVAGHDGEERKVLLWPLVGGDLWKARFAPSELGGWMYTYTFRTPDGQTVDGEGRFEVVPGRVARKGWVRRHPKNSFRWALETGEAFFPVGIQEGVGDGDGSGSMLDTFAMEGPFRLDPEGKLPAPPKGALYQRGPSMGPFNGDFKFRRHSKAGFNLWRCSPNNGLPNLFGTPENPDEINLNAIHWKRAQDYDELFQILRKYDIRIWYGIFGYTHAHNHEAHIKQNMDQVNRLIKYAVDRWGAYVDLWEFFNEQDAWPTWYEGAVAKLREVDPYTKPYTTSWNRPELYAMTFDGPHWYSNEDELQSALVTRYEAIGRRRFGLPILYGEQGNTAADGAAVATWYQDCVPKGIGGVWDIGSARRMRVRLWTAMFQEMGFVFWETSYAKDGHRMNLWIGPEERQYVHALQGFAGQLDADVRPAVVRLGGADADRVEAFGLRSPTVAAVYLHHFGCAACDELRRSGQPVVHEYAHERGEARVSVVVDVPKGGKAWWYEPTTAELHGPVETAAGPNTFIAPAFAVDLALLVTAGPAPDIDGDGVPNDVDEDNDNDGVPDARDAWPLEDEEWADADADRIGDNLDADVDADGRGDDKNGNGTPDCEEVDLDGDGVPQGGAVPWDAFPFDAGEWRDSDGDGIGDNADADDDGDEWSDEEEGAAGTDPLNSVSFPAQ